MAQSPARRPSWRTDIVQPTRTVPEQNGKARRRKSERWSTLNTFVDRIEPHLRPAERQVWLHMFRMATTDNTVVVARSAIMSRTGLSNRGTKNAVKMLMSLKLLRVLVRGRYDRTPTKYLVKAPTDWKPPIRQGKRSSPVQGK